MSPYQPSLAQAALKGSGIGTPAGFIQDDAWRAQWRQFAHALARHAALFSCDVTALLVSATLAYLVWARAFLHQPASLYLQLLPLLCLFPLSYATAGLYPGFGLGPVETLRRLSYSTSISFLVLAAASFAFKADARYSRVTFSTVWLVSLALVPMFRSLAVSTLSAFRWWRAPTVIFGTAAQIELTSRSLKNNLLPGYEVVGALCADRESVGPTIQGVRIFGGVELVPSLVRRGVTTLLAWDSPSVASHLAHIQQHCPHVVFIREEKLLPVEHVQVRNLGGILGIEFTNDLLQRRNQIIKRSIDVAVATVGLLASLPLIAVCGLFIKSVSPGPVFFRQQRGGLHGRKISVWKLRTMVVDADTRLVELLRRDPELKRQWQHSAKLPRDPRLIPVLGAILRRLSLDELPQFWSVIIGDMSLVGPRPFPEYHLDMLAPEFRIFRTAVRPGLTGMWQVMVRSAGGVKEQERFDTYYIRNWSLWLDLYILAKTVVAVTLARGAY